MATATKEILPELQKKPGKALVYIIILGLILIGIGIPLSFIIIGIPLVIAGICVLLAAPIMMFRMRFGLCPQCQAENATAKDTVKCKKCKARLIVEANHFVLVK